MPYNPGPGYRVTSPPGYRSGPVNPLFLQRHGGVDWAAAAGTIVHAASEGVVRFSGFSSTYGNTIIVDHGLNPPIGLVGSAAENIERGGVRPGIVANHGFPCNSRCAGRNTLGPRFALLPSPAFTSAGRHCGIARSTISWGYTLHAKVTHDYASPWQ